MNEEELDLETPSFTLDPVVEELTGWVPPPVPEIEEFPYDDTIDFQRDRNYAMSPREDCKYDAIFQRLLRKHGQISEADADIMAMDYWLTKTKTVLA